MKAKSKQITSFRKEIKGVRNMMVDLLPRTSTFFNPAVWQSPETIQAAFVNLGTGFVGSRLKQLFEELLIDRKTDKDILESEKSKQTLLGLVKFLAAENPDAETWDAAKSIFKKTLQKGKDDEDRAFLYELLSICKHLSGTEIRIIAGCYSIYKKVESNSYIDPHNVISKWSKEVSYTIGLGIPETIMRYEDNLVKQKLIEPQDFFRGDAQGTWNASNGSRSHRLTPLGRQLAESFAKEEPVA